MFALAGAFVPGLVVATGFFAVVLLSVEMLLFLVAVFTFVSALSRLWSAVTVEAVAFPEDIAARTASDCACDVLIITVSITEG